MPTGLRRYYGSQDQHFITCSCYQRQPLLASAGRRDLFLTILERVRLRYRFVVSGYVVMPEHFHLLMTEPEVGTPSTVMQVLKQRVARAAHAWKDGMARVEIDRGPFWQERFYDFNVWTRKKEAEKLAYMHFNPVKRGLARGPDDWEWSSSRFYSGKSVGLVKVNAQEWPLGIGPEGPAAFEV